MGMFGDKTVYPTKAEIKQAVTETVENFKQGWREFRDTGQAAPNGPPSREDESMDSSLTRGCRVRDRIWGGTESGTVTRVDADGSVFVQWDDACFTEDQRRLGEVEQIAGTGDPTPRYAVMYNGQRHEPVKIADDQDAAEDVA